MPEYNDHGPKRPGGIDKVTVPIVLVVLGSVATQDRVALIRTYAADQKSTYAFNSRLDVEMRIYPYETFFPVRYLTNYTFTFDVERQKPDGAADVRFKRPKINIDQSESPWGDAEKQSLDVKQNVLFTMSRTNQVLTLKDETPPMDDKKGGGGQLWTRLLSPATMPQLEIVGNYVQQIIQLAGFVNFFDHGPILPARPVAVGDTWKETKAYAPITVKAGADKGRNLVARLDYEYTFKGQSEWDGKPVTWIQGRLVQDSDAAAYVAELYGYELSAFPISSIKLKLDMTVDYYLDPANLWPLRVVGKSNGEASITIRRISGPVEEVRVKGEAYLTKK